MGYQVNARKGAIMRGWNGHTQPADVVARGVSGEYDVGFVRAPDGGYQALCDWEMSRVDQRGFIQRVTVAYRAELAIANYTSQNMRVVSESVVEETGAVVIELEEILVD
jgi:hypothetical protein